MAQTSRPWNGIVTGDAGPYSDQNWQQLYQSIIGYGAGRSNLGVLLSSGVPPFEALKVQAQVAPTSSIDVLSGSALVQGIAYINTATVAFVIAANSSGNPRIDTVVLRADYALQTVRLAVKQGTPAASPAVPTLTQSVSTLWEIPLADIAVANGFATITDANITPRVEWANASPGVYLDGILNNSGAELNTGDAVIWDITADRAVTTTTTYNHTRPAGVWVGRTAAAGYGRVLVRGIGLVRTIGTPTRGQGLVIGGTIRQFAPVTMNTVGQIGFMLETSPGSARLALAYIDVQRPPVQIATCVQEVAQNTAGAGFTTGAERTIPLNTILSDPYGLVSSITANQVILAPGRYRFLGIISVVAVAGATRSGWLLLHNATAAARLLKSVNYSLATAQLDSLSLAGNFEILVGSSIEFRVLVSTTGWNNQAALNVAGETERYAYVEFERLP